MIRRDPVAVSSPSEPVTQLHSYARRNLPVRRRARQARHDGHVEHDLAANVVVDAGECLRLRRCAALRDAGQLARGAESLRERPRRCDRPLALPLSLPFVDGTKSNSRNVDIDVSNVRIKARNADTTPVGFSSANRRSCGGQRDAELRAQRKRIVHREPVFELKCRIAAAVCCIPIEVLLPIIRIRTYHQAPALAPCESERYGYRLAACKAATFCFVPTGFELRPTRRRKVGGRCNRRPIGNYCRTLLLP